MNNNFQTPQEALKVLFGYDAFRPGQESVIDSILSGKDVCLLVVYKFVVGAVERHVCVASCQVYCGRNRFAFVGSVGKTVFVVFFTLVVLGHDVSLIIIV